MLLVKRESRARSKLGKRDILVLPEALEPREVVIVSASSRSGFHEDHYGEMLWHALVS